MRSFAPQAARDVEAAAEWISEMAGGPDVARRMVQAVVEAADRIASRPGLGRLRLDLVPAPFRFWTVRGFPYLLVYNADRSPTQVVRVLHMARDLPTLLGDLGTEPPR